MVKSLFFSLFSQINSKKILFLCVYLGNSVFLRHIINEKNKRIMKELVEKVAALYADFSKMLTLRLKTVTKQQELVLVRLLWKSKKQ